MAWDPPPSRRLAVIGDSFTFHGPAGPVALADARLYPNRLGRLLEEATGVRWDVQVVARAGWSIRDVWLALQKDPHLQQQVLLGSSAVVLGVGGADALTVGVPRPVTVLLPYLRPAPLRRWVRRSLHRAHPTLVRLTAERLRYTPGSVYRTCWRQSVAAIRLLAPHAALCAVLPAPHAAAHYARSVRHVRATAADTRALAAQLDVPLVDVTALVEGWQDRLNPDGVHWPWALHAAVAHAMAAALLPALEAETESA